MIVTCANELIIAGLTTNFGDESLEKKKSNLTKLYPTRKNLKILLQILRNHVRLNLKTEISEELIQIIVTNVDSKTNLGRHS